MTDIRIGSVKITFMWNESTEVLRRKKHYMGQENKVHENKVLLYCRALR